MCLWISPASPLRTFASSANALAPPSFAFRTCVTRFLTRSRACAMSPSSGSLTVHPEKTRLIPFRRPSAEPARKGPPPTEPPGTFDLLGFAHYWARSRKGSWVVKRKTAPSRFTRAVTKIAQWCQIHRHDPIAEQHQTLSQKLRGHFAYYGITGNSIGLARFRQAVQRVWWEWLGRRRGGNRPTWAKFLQFDQRWPLPPPIALHSVCRVRSKGVT